MGLLGIQQPLQIPPRLEKPAFLPRNVLKSPAQFGRIQNASFHQFSEQFHIFPPPQGQFGQREVVWIDAEGIARSRQRNQAPGPAVGLCLHDIRLENIRVACVLPMKQTALTYRFMNDAGGFRVDRLDKKVGIIAHLEGASGFAQPLVNGEQGRGAKYNDALRRG